MNHMESMLGVFFFALGASLASFAGVAAARLSTGQSIVAGRSRCDACGKPLSAFLLIPIASYVIGRGRARCCGARLSPQFLIAEAISGSVFVGAFFTFGLTPVLPFILVAYTLLLLLVLYDIAHHILPTVPLWLFVAASAVAAFVGKTSYGELAMTVLTAGLLALSLAIIHYASGGRLMGFADVPLVFGLALLVGASAFTGFVFSFWIGALLGIVILLGRPPGSRMGIEVPFAPFLAAGFLLAHITQWNLFTILASFPLPMLF